MGVLGRFLKHMFITPEIIGAQGERKITDKLGWVDFFGKKGKILRNIYVPREGGGTSEIDVLYITEKGLFVIESKNYSGYIFGDEKYRNWAATVYLGKDWLGRKQVEKNSFYNPIWQNNSHIKVLKKYLKHDIPMMSMIVFSERCELKSISVSSSNVIVCQSGDLFFVLQKMWSELDSILSQEEIENIYAKLYPLTKRDTDEKERHIKDIWERQHNTSICPACGGNLVLRTARQGKNCGTKFWGCSNYPKCKYTRNI